MAEFCIHEKHGGICGKTGTYCNLGACPDEDLKEYAPVRHGRWIMGTGENGLQTGYRECSRCGEIVKYGYSLYGVHNFCNYCGAKMNEEA